MKVAIATEENMVSGHFGRCGQYTIVEFDGDRVLNREVVKNPGHECGTIPQYLSEMGVKVIVSGGMGQGALQKFAMVGIQPILGVQGPVDKVIDELIKGTVEGGESLCQGHGEGHGPCDGSGHHHN